MPEQILEPLLALCGAVLTYFASQALRWVRKNYEMSTQEEVILQSVHKSVSSAIRDMGMTIKKQGFDDGVLTAIRDKSLQYIKNDLRQPAGKLVRHWTDQAIEAYIDDEIDRKKKDKEEMSRTKNN